MKRLLLICLLLLIALPGLPAAAQDQTAISPALDEHLTAIEQVTSRLRELDALEDIAHRFPTRDDVRDFLARELNVAFDAETVARETAFYLALGLLPPDVNLRQVYEDFLNSPAGVGGFYDTDDRVMNVLLISGGELGDTLPMLEQITYSHEYTHALQDQHFDLDALLDVDAATETDRALATLTLIEGDATAVMTAYLQAATQQNPLAALAMLAQGFTAGALDLPEGTPPFIVEELTFPYLQGQVFVTALLNDGGWARVNAAYANPPVSTEQVMHPQKYLNGELPLDVALDTAPPAEGWTLRVDRPLGEYYLRALLGTGVPARDAARAAQGWGGDRLHIYESAAGDYAWALRIAWDATTEADEFRLVAGEFGELRYNSPARDGCWSDAQSALCLRVEADDTTRLVGAPTRDIARGLLGG